MKIREDVLAVILLDVINCFILAAPSQPAVCHCNPGADGCHTAAAIRRNRPLCRALPEKIPEADSRPEKNAGLLRAWHVCIGMGCLCRRNLALLTRPALFLDPSCKRC